MTRVMLDALYPNRIPVPQPAGTLIAAYVGHSSNLDSFAQALARFPDHQVISIASTNAVDAQILDVERGAVEPGDFVTMNDWCHRQVKRNVYPTIYCNTSTWPSVKPHLDIVPNWWAARWSSDKTIMADAAGLQWDGVPGYDISVMLDYIEGIDPDMTQPFTDQQLYQIYDQCVKAINAAILPSVQEMYLGTNAPAGRATIASIGAAVSELETGTLPANALTSGAQVTITKA